MGKVTFTKMYDGNADLVEPFTSTEKNIVYMRISSLIFSNICEQKNR